MTRSSFKAGCVMACGLAILLPGCGRGRRAPDGSGTIEATQVRVSAEVSGQLIDVMVEDGTTVARGDTIALIDPTDHRLRLDAARAALAASGAQLDLAIAGARDENIEQARSHVREVQAVANLADSNYDRTSRLFETGSTTQQQLDEVSAAREQAAAALASAQEGLAILLRGNREQDIRMAQAHVDQARAALGLAERSVTKCSVTSPSTGTVTTKVAEAGETIGVGSPIVAITDLDDAWLSVYVAEDRLAGIAIGDSAYVTIDGDDHVYVGVVSFISSQAEFTPRDVQTPDERTKLVYRVKISLANPNRVFKPGMPADGYIGSRP